MENWFKDVGRPALFEALTAACDQVGDDFDNSMLDPNVLIVIVFHRDIANKTCQQIL